MITRSKAAHNDGAVSLMDKLVFPAALQHGAGTLPCKTDTWLAWTVHSLPCVLLSEAQRKQLSRLRHSTEVQAVPQIPTQLQFF